MISLASEAKDGWQDLLTPKQMLAAVSISLAAAADIDHHWQAQLKLARFTDAKADVSSCLNLLQQLMLTIILWAVMGQ